VCVCERHLWCLLFCTVRTIRLNTFKRRVFLAEDRRRTGRDTKQSTKQAFVVPAGDEGDDRGARKWKPIVFFFFSCYKHELAIRIEENIIRKRYFQPITPVENIYTSLIFDENNKMKKRAITTTIEIINNNVDDVNVVELRVQTSSCKYSCVGRELKYCGNKLVHLVQQPGYQRVLQVYHHQIQHV